MGPAATTNRPDPESHPHRVTANMLLMGREARLPPNVNHPVELPEYTTDEYITQLKERLDAVREKLRQSQGPREMPDIGSIYQPPTRSGSNLTTREKGKVPSLVLRALLYQVYEVERGGRKILQHEGRIKAYYAGEELRCTERKEPRGEKKRPLTQHQPPDKKKW